MMIFNRILLPLVVPVFLAALVPAVAHAEVETPPAPAWSLRAIVAPSNLSPDAAVSEVQEIPVNATGGNVVVAEPVSFEEYERHSIGLAELKHAEFPYNADHEEAQAGLEGVYGKGNVAVSGGGALAIGTGNLSGANISGTLTEGLTEVKEVAVFLGTLETGQVISGGGLPSGTTITAYSETLKTLTLSAAAKETNTGAGLSARSDEVKGVATTAGAFKTGQEIAGKGIPSGTTITAVGAGGAGTLTLSQPPEEPGNGVALAVVAPYTVTFTGALAGREVRRMNTSLSVSVGGLEGGAGTAKQEGECEGQPPFGCAAVVTPGRSAGVVIVTATNLGDRPATLTSGDPLKVSVTLPEGVTATSIGFNHLVSNYSTIRAKSKSTSCDLAALTCEAKGNGEHEASTVLIYEPVEVVIHVNVEQGAHTGPIVMSASGAAAAPVSAADPLTISEAPVRFGLDRFETQPLNADGSLDTQAGSHPFQFTTTLAYNESAGVVSTAALDELPEELFTPHEELVNESPALPKDLKFELPPGLIGDPSAVPRCPLGEFDKAFVLPHCESDTQVGAITPLLSPVGSNLGGIFAYLAVPEIVPVYNLEPAPGEPARFGFGLLIQGEPIRAVLDTSVRTGGNYGVVVTVHDIPQELSFLGSQLSLWGDPGDPRHDLSRPECIENNEFGVENCKPAALPQAPFLSLPASCSGASNPFTARVQATSWAEPGVSVPDSYTLHNGAGEPLGMTGCNQLAFDPSLTVAPSGEAASTPTALNVGIHVDQTAALNPTGLTDADVKDTTVTLPEGVQLSPSAADGLQSCSLSQIGFTGVNGETGVDEFTPAAPSCPDASKIANVKIKTPLLPNELKGAVYLAAPQNFAGPLENPFSSLIAMYLVAEDPVSGVLVKLPGRVSANSETGQLVSSFENTPQLPFEDLNIEFYGSARAPLATPAHCGSYTTLASFTPSTEAPSANASSTFNITAGPEVQTPSGPQHTPCPGTSLPFSPSLSSETTDIQAGGFSPLSTTLGREDGQQAIQNVTLHYPPGVTGILKGVPLCSEAQANAGTCGEESRIGETTVSAGLGSDPYTVTGGKVYLTEKYAGAPFGLSIVTTPKAGPFVLQHGEPVVVRAKIEVNPVSAALTVTTTTIPKIIDGIPLQIKHVNVNINGVGGNNKFTINPTNCNPMTLTGTINGWEGGSSAVADPFQVTNCAILKYTPQVVTATAGKASKANGASLKIDVSYPKGAVGTQSWFNYAKFVIPKQLPARLTTLQKACLASEFEKERSKCPPASIIGHAIVHTSVLPVPLEGPVYFVSYGGAAFPDVVMVLKGYGVTIELHGHTLIKGGVTSATFESLPDVPFESIEVTLPQGPFSEFGANLPNRAQSFCGQKLVLPVRFKASNGLEITQNTPVGVTGCPKAKTRAQLYAAALKACHKDRNKARRQSCERAARKKYGAKASKTKRKK